eukprot:15449813-Alexandrium_andersonii.AAC.1
MGRNNHTVAGSSGHSLRFYPKHSLGSRGPSSSNGPSVPLHRSESVNVRARHNADPSNGGAGEAQRLWCPPLNNRAPMFAESESWRGPFGQFAALGPQPPRTGLGKIANADQ